MGARLDCSEVQSDLCVAASIHRHPTGASLSTLVKNSIEHGREQPGQRLQRIIQDWAEGKRLELYERGS